MAYGEHWEWRGFGGVSSRFARAYTALELKYDLHKVEDLYLRIPGMRVNAKFREGIEDGLKFKYMLKKEENLEIWREDEEDLFDFPLGPDAWTKLGKMLKEVNIRLPDYPPAAPGREATIKLLGLSGCRIVKLVKEREMRIWTKGDNQVLVEWTVIKEPQQLISIGLESWSEKPDRNLADNRSKEVIKNALRDLSLEEEALIPMNYLDAVDTWSSGSKL